MQMMTGLLPPTPGLLPPTTIDGLSITSHMVAIRYSLGVCPQQNVLFDQLTRASRRRTRTRTRTRKTCRGGGGGRRRRQQRRRRMRLPKHRRRMRLPKQTKESVLAWAMQWCCVVG